MRQSTVCPRARKKKKRIRRVQKEELSPRYIELDQYLSYYDEETARTKLSVFETDASKLGLELLRGGRVDFFEIRAMEESFK